MDQCVDFGKCFHPGQIAIQLYPSNAAGAYLSPSELDRTIVPTASSFSAAGFVVVSVSGWILDTTENAYYLAIQLAPATDVVGDPNGVGPASLAINANAYFDIYGNGNSGVGSGNSFGYLSFLGIDRVSPKGPLPVPPPPNSMVQKSPIRCAFPSTIPMPPRD